MLASAVCDGDTPRHLWLFDSFQGLPAADRKDGPSAALMEDRLNADESQVARLLQDHGIPRDKVTIIPGWFADTLRQARIANIAFLHIDADWYGSVKRCLEDLYDRVVPRGIIVLDDYEEWPGCKLAVDEFVRERGLAITLEGGGDVPFFFRKPHQTPRNYAHQGPGEARA